MPRYFIYLSYNGADFCGWQVQPNGVSVQGSIEEKLTLVLRTPTSIVGAGRTDAGVHAKKMVAHFDSENKIDTILLTEKLNRMLPRSIAIQYIVPVSDTAHARFDATSRTYHYYLSLHKDPFGGEFTMRYHTSLDVDAMNNAAKKLFNYTDFTSFSKLHTDVKTNNCAIMQAYWEEMGDGQLRFTIKADRFLRNMVRAIVGTLLEVGRHKITIDDFCNIIESQNRCKAGESVPAHALFLVDIQYPYL